MRSEGGAEHISFMHSGDVLKYEVQIIPSRRAFAISADTRRPFCGESLYEIYLHFDGVISLEDPYVLGRPTVALYIGESYEWKNCVLTMNMRKGGELVVWPRETCNRPTTEE